MAHRDGGQAHRTATEYDLAWDLAAAVDAVLTAPDRADVFAKIGAGETYGAIAVLLSCALRMDTTLDPALHHSRAS